MPFNDLLLMELDSEAPGTRKTLERVPMTADFTPHEKSMTLGSLATHLAEIPGYGIAVVTQPELNFATSKRPAPPFESGKQLIAHFDGLMRELRDAVANLPESAWREPWRLLWGDKVLFEGPRFV